MSLNENPKNVQWGPSHYVYIELKGNFMQTAPQAWQTLNQHLSQIQEVAKVEKFMSLYKIEPEMIYRAGVTVREKPAKLPPGFHYEELNGGKYSCFTLKGSYSQLPEACGKVFKKVSESKTPVRADFNIEHYVNDPKTTPEVDLMTEILIPIQ